jgi:hypothetical protein
MPIAPSRPLLIDGVAVMPQWRWASTWTRSIAAGA